MKYVTMVTLTIITLMSVMAVMATQLTQTMGLKENTPETTTGNITEPIAPG
jgi:hypothetical protein